MIIQAACSSHWQNTAPEASVADFPWHISLIVTCWAAITDLMTCSMLSCRTSLGQTWTSRIPLYQEVRRRARSGNCMWGNMRVQDVKYYAQDMKDTLLSWAFTVTVWFSLGTPLLHPESFNSIFFSRKLWFSCSEYQSDLWATLGSQGTHAKCNHEQKASHVRILPNHLCLAPCSLGLSL